ncbi:MAG: UDP-N-acetylmuramoyl-tripeptide--D-alanyl-D-alanine ligase [Clostridia bacterium]|nr:UDP-N-acetylmuramoyl-tripeptide--D-alanyl-D-alanine ligase [Clostridia bacterium]
MLPLDIEKITHLFSGQIIVSFILIGLINAVLMMSISYRFLQAMQQCGYKGADYFKWLARKDNVYFTRLFMLSLLSTLGFILINMALSFIDNNLVDYAGFIVYFVFLAIFYMGELKKKDKVPLVLTKRMIRLSITYYLSIVLFSVVLVLLVNFIAIPFRTNLLANFRYAILCFCPIAVPYLLWVAYYINEPFEKLNIKKYVEKCKEKLSSYDNLIKIGITGSCGKTSVKEILKTILSEKYKVVATPESYNTPLGITKTVKRLDGTEDIFIAEMGARRVGDIKELTNIVKPNIAVVTGVVCQHLETFNALDNIKKTKYEIIENMEEGTAFFSADNEHTREMHNKCKLKSKTAGIDVSKKPYVYATNIKTNENGTTFTLFIGKKSIETSTLLLGKHNVSNICLAVAVADSLGLTIEEIARAIPRIRPIKHRLELIKSQNGVSILDDSYNANPEGVRSALEVLKNFSGTKFVVTPGIVELGFLESQKNYEFGLEISKVANIVILVGRARALRIREGLLSSGFDSKNIIMVSTLEDAKQELSKIVKSGDAVLFENDLPDKYL